MESKLNPRRLPKERSAGNGHSAKLYGDGFEPDLVRWLTWTLGSFHAADTEIGSCQVAEE